MPCLLVAGLGNPSAKYQNTRHNIGFMVLDFLSKELDFDFSFDKKFNAEVGAINIGPHKVFFLKPQTFMNLSGEAINPFVRYFDITHTFVIHDDIDIGFGDMRFKYGGSSGGHNGLKSIDSFMGDTYFRLRFGVGRSANKNVVEYVLSDFNAQEREQLEGLIAHAKELRGNGPFGSFGRGLLRRLRQGDQYGPEHAFPYFRQPLPPHGKA